MIDFSKYDYAIFDCDGVILDSNHLKTEAFAEALKNEPDEYVEDLLDYHKLHGGVSRYHKFRHFYEQINPTEDAEVKIRQAISKFAEIVRNGLMECDCIPGALDFIKSVNKEGLQLFVVSGSDEEELKGVFKERKIINLFENIFGSPPTKMENTEKVVSMVGYDKSGIFFGDASSDMKAAEAFSLEFVFVVGASEWLEGTDVIKDKGYLFINDFNCY